MGDRIEISLSYNLKDVNSIDPVLKHWKSVIEEIREKGYPSRIQMEIDGTSFILYHEQTIKYRDSEEYVYKITLGGGEK